ncbi:MAG: hypothetical protein PVH71_00875 [Chromatiales bacterium]|mgnify:CR=1 FL=1
MSTRFISILILKALLTTAVYAGDMQLVLELQKIEDDEVVDRLSLYSSQVDPNVRSVTDRFRLEHNGNPVKAPLSLLERLNHERRSYSYDNFTKGIRHETRKELCMMAGPAIGDLLYVRYLTYRDHLIVKSEMRPVLSEAGNCLFAEVIAPEDQRSGIAAMKALASFQVMREFVSP